MLVLLLIACAPDPAVDTAPDVPRGAIAFGFPLPEREKISSRVGVDHDPVVQDDSVLGHAICTDYLGRGFPNCYDEHDGSDFLLDGGFDTMDAGSTPIVAAADGTVLEVEDGHYDRCHADLETGDVSCDGNPYDANYVIVEHEGGWRSMYWHMKKDSVQVAPGQAVRCGDPLGLVGSSGYSSAPHLHFEVQAEDGTVIDPYAGPYSQPETWWAEQGEPEALPGAGCAGS